MEYTEEAKYSQLNSESDFYKEFLPIVAEIETLANGGRFLNPNDYLLMRDGEDSDITKKRLEKFCPENYLGAAIRIQRVNQKSGQLEVRSQSLPTDEIIDQDKWQKFLYSVDKKHSNVKDFVLDVFENALINKYVFVQIELRELSDELNVAQIETIDTLPYYFVIPIQCVMAESSEGREVKWLKYKRMVTVEDPLEGTSYNFQYILVDDKHITIWQYDDVTIRDGSIHQIWDQKLNNGKGSYRNIRKTDLAIPKSIEHKRGKCPIVKYEMDDSLYMAHQVKDAQRIIYGLGMNLLHTAANSGFVQKWGKPILATGNAPNGLSYIPIPKDALAEIVKQYAESMGDESIMMMEHFTFEELKGDSIKMQREIIDSLKQYIFTTILFNNAQFQQGNNSRQSGAAKEIDFHIQNLALKDHGSTIIEFTQDLLTHTAYAFGLSGDFHIEVSGMDRFDIRPIREALNLASEIFALPDGSVPNEVYVEVMTQLSSIIVENNTQQFKANLSESIKDRIESFSQANEQRLIKELSEEKPDVKKR